MLRLALASGVGLVGVLNSVCGYPLSSASLSLTLHACYRVRSRNNVNNLKLNGYPSTHLPIDR